MNISRLMVHSQNVEKARPKRKSRGSKRARSHGCGTSKGRLKIQDKPRLKKRDSNQVPSKFPKARDDRVSRPKSKGRDTSSTTNKPTCGMYGKKHYGYSLKRMDNCFGCGKCGHKARDFPYMRGQDKVSGQAQASGSNEAPKKNFFYALCSRGEKRLLPKW